MKVRELKAALLHAEDDQDVVLRVDDDDCTLGIVTTPDTAAVETGCDDESFFAIDVIIVKAAR